MYSQEFLPNLDRILRKLAKKNPVIHEALRGKVKEILKEPHHYKPLGNVMAGKRRVHVGSFVLIFSIDEARKVVVFEDFEHHDKVYGG
jgi:YafQ family addiction module toxin component